MSDTHTNNKRIVKNALALYLRMIIMILVSLYTVRIVIRTLGFEDYGVYQVVAMVIVFFTFLNNGLSSASNRYITAEIGKGTKESGNHVFNICFQTHTLIALVIIFLAETIGLYVLNAILKIPENRIFAANIVYQFSIITAVINIISSPFNTTLIAYERMNIFAYIAIFDAIMKLLVVFLIQLMGGDKLILYAFLLLIVSVIHAAINYIYCYKNFSICHLKIIKDIPLLKSIFNFTGWSLLGQTCIVGTNQGVTALVNYFFGVIVNAALGISNQILNIATQFVTNFQTAFRPQIVKSYVNNNAEYLNSLIMRSSKISSLLAMALIIPLSLEISNILKVWLGDYPEYTVEFVQWTLYALFFDCITGPLWMTINAQTDIKKYQIWTSVFFSMNFILGWLILYLGNFPPYSVMIIRVFVYIALIVVRLHYTKKFFTQFSISEWVINVLVKSFIILILSLTIANVLLTQLTINIWKELFIVTVFSETIIFLLCYTLLFSKAEKIFVNSMFKRFLHRLKG